MGKYLDKISGREPGECVPSIEGRQATPVPFIRPGDLVEWTRGGQPQAGTVDWIHTDPDGQQWAFVSFGKTWAVVNLKFVKVLR